ncbi:hypothetical protein Y032_0483g2300 [Ancylostoma ceylanicum]|uniref:Uncharacterized protein n=1 Tax=Ancylostoma ceylanicum TaxID=53326 RepID=A0A016WXG7_9BILA|nr:hypothetical protein Y032_0483g2300 [Ancylostoma ceylanicum]
MELWNSTPSRIYPSTHSRQCAQPIENAWCDAWGRVLSRVSTPFSELYFCEAVIISKLLHSVILTNVQGFYTSNGQSRHPPVLL